MFSPSQQTGQYSNPPGLTPRIYVYIYKYVNIQWGWEIFGTNVDFLSMKKLDIWLITPSFFVFMKQFFLNIKTNKILQTTKVNVVFVLRKKILPFYFKIYLEYCNSCPEKRIKILPVRGSKLILELTSKQVHPKNTKHDNKFIQEASLNTWDMK